VAQQINLNPHISMQVLDLSQRDKAADLELQYSRQNLCHIHRPGRGKAWAPDCTGVSQPQRRIPGAFSTVVNILLGLNASTVAPYLKEDA
jgi:hypothetical protein